MRSLGDGREGNFQGVCAYEDGTSCTDSDTHTYTHTHTHMHTQKRQPRVAGKCGVERYKVDAVSGRGYFLRLNFFRRVILVIRVVRVV